MEKVFFSIVIPTLNEEKFLPKLLGCLARQKFSRFEVIVVDGESEDKTIKVAENWTGKLAKKKIDLVVIKSEKRNVSYQRNLGAKKARGEYLVFFDADVEIGKDFLAKVHKHIQEEETLLMTTWLEPDSKEVVDELLVLLTNYSIELTKYMRRPFMPGFNIIVEKNLFFALGGFDETVKHSEDHLFIQRAKKKGVNFRFLKEPSLTVSLRRFRSEGRVTVLRKYMKSLTYILIKGKIDKNLFDYPMGGAYHLNHKRASLWERIKRRLL